MPKRFLFLNSTMHEQYQYRASVKSSLSDELVNTYFLRPIAGLLVRLLYPTPITPNQVTLAAIGVGLVAAALYFSGSPPAIALGGLAVMLKDLLDSADGQLARAKKLYSRRGRFLDSIGDLVVDAAVFAALGWTVARSDVSAAPFLLALIGFAGITLRVSYHVFYQASYLHLEGKYEQNRIVEEITEADRRGDPVALKLQLIFMALYGWQDRLMLRIDEWCGGTTMTEQFRQRWYGDRIGLQLSGLLGFGTELFVLTVCSVLNELQLYLMLNLILMNGILFCSILYRRFVLRRRLTFSGGISGAGGSA